MKSSNRSVGLISVALLMGSMFAACGGLDDRKITRDREYSAGGDDNGGKMSAGGSDSQAGQPVVNPFGGEFVSGGAPVVVGGPPTVLAVAPEDGAVDVELEASVSFLFSEAVDPTTLTIDSVQLLDGADPINGDVTATADQVATFEPARRLSLATTYQTSVSTAVTDTTGEALNLPFASTFTTRDGVWDDAQPFVADPSTNWNYYTSTASISSDARGNTLVVWKQADGVQARWYRPASGWQESVKLSTVGAFVEATPSVAASPDGDAFAVWTEVDDTGYHIVARRYVGGAWGAESEPVNGMMAIPTLPLSGPNVRFNGASAVIWWTHVNQGYKYIAAQSATIKGAWKSYPDTVAYVNTATEEFGSYQPVAMDNDGNALLVYNAGSAADVLGQLHYARFVASTGDWEPAAPVANATNVNYGSTISAALDDSGNAAVIWVKSTGDVHDLMASRYTKAKGFGTPVPVDDLDTGPRTDWRNGIVRAGEGFVLVWGQDVGATLNVYASHYADSQGTWTQPQLVSDGLTGVFDQPTVVGDRHGNAMAVWPQNSGANDQTSDHEFRFARWRNGSAAWSAPEVVISGLNFINYQYYQASVAGNGYIAFLAPDGGNFTDRPGQPFLSVFH